MSTTDDRLVELRQQLAETVARLAELERHAIDAMIEAQPERDISAIITRQAQTRDRVALLTKVISELVRQQQLADQQRMLAQTMEAVAPLTKALDDSASKLLLPPHVPDKPVQLVPEVIPAKKVGRWPGNPLQGATRWNQRAR